MKPASTSKPPPTPMITGTSRRWRWRSHQVSLKGVGRPTNSMSAACPDFLDDGLVVFATKIAVAKASDLNAGVLDTARFDQRCDHLAPRAEKIDAEPVRAGHHQQARHQVDTGHALRYRLARQPQCPDHRHAVSYEVSRPAGPAPAPDHGASCTGGKYWCNECVRGAGGVAKLEIPGHCSIGHRVEGKARQLGPLDALHRRLIETREPDGWRTRGRPARR
jgi:hypothetical protein